MKQPGRGLSVAVAIVLVVVVTVAMAVFAQPSNVFNIAAAPPDIASAPQFSVTKTPPIPQFYNVDSVPPAEPGTLVKSEPIPGSPEGTTTSRFIYHSRDNHGADTVVSGMYSAPTTPPPPGGFPLITLSHGTTGANRHCGPSLTPFEPNQPGYYTFDQQMLPLVQQGYAVVATDYQGMGAPGTPSYLVGQIEAQNTLDAVRAVHEWQPNIDKSKTLIWGHSQGGHASAFAAEYAASYAPELQIQGSAVLAPGLLPSLPLAVTGLLGSTEPSGQTGFVMLIAVSWAAAYPDQISLQDILTPAGLAKIDAVNTLCGSQQSQAFMDHPMSYYVKDPIPAVFYSLATQNTPGMTTIDMPIWMVQGMKDTTIIPQLTLAFDKLMCQNGTTVDFHIYSEDNHGGVVVNSRELGNTWIKDRFNGLPAPNNCTNK